LGFGLTPGAKLFEQTGITGILTENGRVRGVETMRGTVSCDAVALCAGLWSREVGPWRAHACRLGHASILPAGQAH
jgi:glycine/D-amino acid oxidase-like deaminating enzyme